MRIAYMILTDDVMDKVEYESLVKRRNALVDLESRTTYPRHKMIMAKELSSIRQQIKNAHRESNSRTNSKS